MLTLKYCWRGTPYCMSSLFIQLLTSPCLYVTFPAQQFAASHLLKWIESYFAPSTCVTCVIRVMHSNVRLLKCLAVSTSLPYLCEFRVYIGRCTCSVCYCSVQEYIVFSYIFAPFTGTCLVKDLNSMWKSWKETMRIDYVIEGKSVLKIRCPQLGTISTSTGQKDRCTYTIKKHVIEN